MKKLINDPNQVAREALEGMALAYPQYVRLLDGVQAVLRTETPTHGHVAVLTGGGSGHEPMFAGYVGRGMAHASVAGNIFASPPPPPIVATGQAIHSGAGILFLYGNYAGDILNFDMAAEMLDAEGIRVVTVRITDDVASAPPDRMDERRGIGGDFFVVKAAGARADEGATLDEVVAATQEANANTRTMAIALSSCTIPAVGKPIFDIGEDEMELGMGMHGELGTKRGPIRSADEVAQEIISHILKDMPMERGTEVAVLVNGMGATPLGELLVIFRTVHRLLGEAGLKIARTYVGNFVTSLEMAGCSVTLMRLTPLLKRLLHAPCASPGWSQEQE